MRDRKMKRLAAYARMRGPGGRRATLFTTEEEGEDTAHTEKGTQPSACLPDPSPAAPRRGSAARPPTHGAGTNNQPCVALRSSSVLGTAFRPPPQPGLGTRVPIHHQSRAISSVRHRDSPTRCPRRHLRRTDRTRRRTDGPIRFRHGWLAPPRADCPGWTGAGRTFAPLCRPGRSSRYPASSRDRCRPGRAAIPANTGCPLFAGGTFRHPDCR